MKRFTALLLVLVSLLALAACGKGGTQTDNTATDKPNTSAEDDGYLAMLDCAIRLIAEYTPELMDKVIPPEETEFYIKYYGDQGRDYLTEIGEQFGMIGSDYAKVYGDDWKLSFTVKSVDEKDQEGMEKYLNYDHYYFNSFGMDMKKVDKVVFVTVNIHIEGSKDENDKEKTLQCFRYDGNWYSFYGALMGTKL